jgi:hypothetical protein
MEFCIESAWHDSLPMDDSISGPSFPAAHIKPSTN